MHWQKDPAEKNGAPQSSALITDLSFRISCPRLPVDHSWPLKAAIEEILPWIGDEPLAAIHNVYGAPSSNGWNRPVNPDDIIHLSRRTRLRLRLPLHRAEEAKKLENRTLKIDNHLLAVSTGEARPLIPHQTLFARYLPDASGGDDRFLDAVLTLLQERNIRPPRMMGGLAGTVCTPDGTIATRSLMVDGLKPEESLLLQEYGIGRQGLLGFGIFLPHKGIDSVYETNN